MLLGDCVKFDPSIQLSLSVCNCPLLSPCMGGLGEMSLLYSGGRKDILWAAIEIHEIANH